MYLFIISISIILFSEELTIFQIGHLKGDGYYQDIKVEGRYAFVAAGKRGVIIVDVTDPASPKELNEIESMDYTYSLDVQGFILFMADGKAGVRIFDIRDIKNPEQKGFIPTLYSSQNIKISGQYGYVAEGKGGLRIIDCLNPDFPKEITRYSKSVNIKALDIADGYAYLADKKGVLILDIRNPDSIPDPIQIDAIDSISTIQSDGRWLFASGGEKDFMVSNIAVPQYPITQKIPGGYKEIKDIFLSGFHLYLAQGDFGVSILDVLIPYSPEQVNHTIISFEACGIYVSGNLLYIASGYDGLNIYKITGE